MKCPSCGSNSTIRDNARGKEVCTRCGLILLEKKMSKEPEWHNKPGKNQGRADLSSGSDINYHDLGLGSEIGGSRDLSPAWRAKLRRLRKWHKRSRAVNYREKSLRKALINLDKLCEDLSLPKSVKSEVSALFRKARKKEVTPGRNTWSVLASLLFIVSRMRRIPRTEKEVTKVMTIRTELERRGALKALRRIRKALEKELDLEVPRPKPKEYINRFISKLELSKKTKAESYRVCKSLPKKFKSRKASFLIASAVIYNTARKFDEDIKIREVADVLEVGVSSVSKTGKKIRNLLNET